MAHFVFTAISLFTVICALGVVASRNTVNGAMCLVLCLVGVAGLFIQLHAYVLGFFLLMIYAGAVAILFLFIIMLLDPQGGRPTVYPWMSMFASVATAGLLIGGLNLLAERDQFHVRFHPGPVVGSALRPYAYELFTRYLLPVEVIGFLLLIAMIGVIVLSKRFDTEGAK